ncbi:hemolysin III family protein [Mesonia sp. HuA40]|uniref:PAQR family membrane homeostasis protein TrhA n=1 Tax=Mesonia sp. HuA40 TaxID=2602761 RepID=UPI0011CB82D9|nr:hemolysin III family protein [Mesonia sp. HuA40]TXK73567.1 hemolysin III family protein [Mesonia sp. HuA40]
MKTSSRKIFHHPSYYNKKEEKLNVVSHGLGLILSLIGLCFLLHKSTQINQFDTWVAYTIYGFSLILLYAASTAYHYTKDRKIRYRLNILDHAAIFVLIAGTYTPFTLLALPESTGHSILYLVWGIALLGVILKLFFTGRFNIVSTLLYVGMGWIILLVFEPLSAALSQEGLFWLFAGGAVYTMGAVLYSIPKLPYHHAIFHIFVLLGSLFHFLCIYNYLPI